MMTPCTARLIRLIPAIAAILLMLAWQAHVRKLNSDRAASLADGKRVWDLRSFDDVLLRVLSPLHAQLRDNPESLWAWSNWIATCEALTMTVILALYVNSKTRIGVQLAIIGLARMFFQLLVQTPAPDQMLLPPGGDMLLSGVFSAGAGDFFFCGRAAVAVICASNLYAHVAPSVVCAIVACLHVFNVCFFVLASRTSYTADVVTGVAMGWLVHIMCPAYAPAEEK